MGAVSSIAGAVAAKAVQSTLSATGSEGAEDRFLKLLVTQLKNQDPLNPMDNAEITSQMAQISTVSGIDKLNSTMQAMATAFSANQSLEATAMVGHRVLVPGSTLQLQNGAAAGGLELLQAADRVSISIKDGSGQVVHRVDLGPQPAGVVSFQWDGVVDSGASAAPGSYSFAVEAAQGGKKIDATALALGLVGGVMQGKTGVLLNVNGMGAVALSDVKQVR
ncbi:MAG: flagellar hook assembly protein FlgD [Dechloromonas sp.]|uniref:Basal-body rod modification protein FlgD n=1 Tax=Candidatus Dechloromonas phosphorivorans TaxID=2899244 RepID=A0A9D7LP56_9RHOO|nr:flagellar hook assembly protein FlgD [Candidatus Dechloromonas phosphorivorans]